MLPPGVQTTQDAKESALRQNLSAVRDAIELYKVQNGKPSDSGTEADLKADLTPYLHRFPDNPIKEVAVQITGAAFIGTASAEVRDGAMKTRRAISSPVPTACLLIT